MFVEKIARFFAFFVVIKLKKNSVGPMFFG